jgi:hypothetical protein
MKHHREPKAVGSAAGVAGLEIRLVESAAELERFETLMVERHYLGADRPAGDYLRQVAVLDGQWVGLLSWGAAALKLKDRDNWIGWTPAQRLDRLKLVVQNRRFLLLVDRGRAPNLASRILGAAARELPGQWRGRFSYAPMLAESFTDPEQFEGTCYKASGWEPVGLSSGHSRHRLDFYVPNGRPKRLWLKPLCPDAVKRLRALELEEGARAALVAAPGGLLPVDQPRMLSLFELFRAAPDPRERNCHFRIGPALTIVAMALLAGARDISQIARFATRLKPRARALLDLPFKKGVRAVRQVPGYSVFYQLLRRMDPEAFATALNGWLAANAGDLPEALAMDGKMIRDRVGLVSLAAHSCGSPRALAVMDQKQGGRRCEQSASAGMLDALGSLEAKTLTADPLHCQKSTARAIVEKGGEYLLQIKANQPGLLRRAKAADAAMASPLLNRPRPATAASRPGR